MTRYEIEKELDSLYRDYEIACNSDEDVVCKVFNADSKKEFIELLVKEIDTYEALLEEFDKPDDDGMDYVGLQLSQGLPSVFR
jgi:hypothetical protein